VDFPDTFVEGLGCQRLDFRFTVANVINIFQCPFDEERRYIQTGEDWNYLLNELLFLDRTLGAVRISLFCAVVINVMVFVAVLLTFPLFFRSNHRSAIGAMHQAGKSKLMFLWAWTI